MKKIPILNISEGLTHEILASTLSGTGFKVFPRLSLSKILNREKNERLSKSDRKFIQSSEFDFVVVNSDLEAEFVIEFDGPKHLSDVKQIERDIRKNRICNIANLPLIRITYLELEEFDKYSILEYMVSRFIAWQVEFPEIKQEISDYLNSLDEEEKKSLFDGGIADPSIDPGFRFDLKHPFPKTLDLVKRLFEKYKIVSLKSEPFIRLNCPSQAYYFYCDLLCNSMNGINGFDIISRCDYKLLRSANPFYDLSNYFSEEKKKSSSVVMKGSIDIKIRWALPIVNDWNPQESAAEYTVRTGQLPLMFHGLPGVSPNSIASNMVEYLGLREIEKWSLKNLLS